MFTGSTEIFSLTFSVVINAVILWGILSQSWRVVTNRYFATAVAFVIFWSAGTMLLVAPRDPGLLNLGIILFLVVPMYLILFLAFFAALFPSPNGNVFTKLNTILLFITIPFSLIITVEPSLLLTGTVDSGIVSNKIGYLIYTAYFCFAFFVAFSELYMHIRRARGYQRQQLIYIFVGTFAAAFASLVTGLSFPVFGITQFLWLGPVWTLFYVVTVGIAIVKHQLFDIKLAVVRSVAYISVLVTLSLIYYAFAYFISLLIIGTQVTEGLSVSPVNVLLALALAFLFQPVKRFFDRFTDNIFYRDNYRSEDFFAALSNLLTSTVDLRGLLERASHEIAETLKAEHAAFFVYYSGQSDHHMSAGTHGYSRLPMYDARMLDSFVTSSAKTQIFFTDAIGDSDVRRMLASHRISLVMPLRQGDGIVGHLMLGEHLSGNYKKRDLDVLLAVSNELVIAIQNALSLHEVKELNATLQQRIDVATKELRSSNAQLKHLDEVKDEFISMASHQLRTPLTSVKGYISMVLEGDAGKITPRQRTLLLEAFNSSERMVGLIADFLNVSRLQTGKFVLEKRPVDLKNIIKQEVEDLGLIAKSHDMKLRLNVTNEPLLANADESKIRQVVMNFIDNAIYYSTPGSTIIIKLEKVGKSASFTVIDTGIGVPAEEQSKLFGKFFRAHNARRQRPDGTGVGLYLAKRVVTGHGGSVIFSSKEGKGSTFGFMLPLSSDESVKTTE